LLHPYQSEALLVRTCLYDPSQVGHFYLVQPGNASRRNNVFTWTEYIARMKHDKCLMSYSGQKRGIRVI
jgi:hypothetical protein